MPEDKIVSHAKVGIIGGGIMGVSLLYHLAKEGWKDLVLIEKGELTSGSTWHAAGQCPQMTGSYNLAKVHLHSTNLYKTLEKETGQPTGWHGCGSLRLAYKQEDLDWFYYVKGILDNVGAPAEIISTNEIKKIHPFIKLDGIMGAFHTPEDGHTDPTSTTNAMAKGARNAGATIYRNNRVTDIKHRSSGEWELITEKGNIICEHVVNAAGSYCPEVGAMVGLKNIPSINMIHHYLVTDEHPEIKKLKKELPVVRDPVSSCYLRQEGKGLLIGIYEKNAKCWALDGMDWKFNMELLEPELDRLEEHLDKGMSRIPQFRDVGIKKIICGSRKTAMKQEEVCEICNSKLDVAGPLWVGQLFEKEFVMKMNEMVPKLVVDKRCQKILEKCILESEMPATYYTLDEIASKMQKSPLKMKKAIKKLQDAGFVASPTSLNPTGFRTDCRIDEILKLFS